MRQLLNVARQTKQLPLPIHRALPARRTAPAKALPCLLTNRWEETMKRVTGIGGIFFNARDPAALRGWYQTHLGIDVQAWGGTAFPWADDDGKPTTGMTIWSIGEAGGDHFAPSQSAFMINYRVADVHALIAALRTH